MTLCRAFVVAILCLSLPLCSHAQVDKIAPDQWVTNAAQFPVGIATNPISLKVFASLRAEEIGGQLKIYLGASAFPTNTSLTLFVSADELGHWPARDWRTQPLVLRGSVWEATVPVDDVDTPMLYFVRAGTNGENVSPMRLCRPRAAGMEIPSRVFWPFLEGFEEGLDGWRWLAAAPNAPPLRTSSVARSGHAALLVTLSAGENSATIATTRVRGWQIQQRFATGLRLWLRAPNGDGRARFTLLANAFATNQTIAIYPQLTPLSNQWQQVDLPFAAFPKLPWHAVDLFTIEFLGVGPREFLVDDLQLLGPWRAGQ